MEVVHKSKAERIVARRRRGRGLRGGSQFAGRESLGAESVMTLVWVSFVLTRNCKGLMGEDELKRNRLMCRLKKKIRGLFVLVRSYRLTH